MVHSYFDNPQLYDSAMVYSENRMSKKIIDTSPARFCKFCDDLLSRKTYPGGASEQMSKYLGRTHCPNCVQRARQQNHEAKKLMPDACAALDRFNFSGYPREVACKQ